MSEIIEHALEEMNIKRYKRVSKHTVRLLISEIEALKRQNEFCREQLAKALKGLKFYATSDMSELMDDYGETAEQTLKEIGEPPNE
jgi:hypothetical protein